MKPIDKKVRHWLLGSALILISCLVWWTYLYPPLQDQRDELFVAVSEAAQESERLKLRLQKLSEKKQAPLESKEMLSRFATVVGPGNSLEEVSSHTQQWVREFLKNYDLSLKSYKGLSPSMWKDYPLSQIEFQLDADIQGLSDLLENLENTEKTVRIEKLSVNYRRSKENGLRVTLRLGTLFVEGLRE